MNQRFVLAVLGYLVPTFLLGYFWHLAWFHPVYQALAIYRADIVIPMGMGSMLIQGVIFAWAYPRLFDTSPTGWMRGVLGAGVTFALLSWSFTTLAVGAKHPMTSVPQFFGIETAFTCVQFLLTAPLMGLAWRGADARG